MRRATFIAKSTPQPRKSRSRRPKFYAKSPPSPSQRRVRRPKFRPTPRRFTFEPLEPRLLLSATPLDIDLGTLAKTDVQLRVLEQSSTETVVQLVDNATENAPVLVEKDLDEVSNIRITGSGSDETLTIDASLLTALNNNTANTVNITFDAGGGSDTLVGPDGDSDWTHDGTTWKLSGPGSNWTGTLSFSNVGTVEGGNGDDDLSGTSSAETWAVTDANTVTLDGINFSGINELSGGSDDTLDYSVYASGVEVDLGQDVGTGFAEVTGFIHLTGSDFDDLLIGDSANNTILGGLGDDDVGGGLGLDTLSGGAGVDTLVERQDADLTLRNTSLANGTDTDVLSGFELADLTGGASGNIINASAFTGLNTGTPLAFLNSGAGVGRAATATDADLKITLQDGSSVDINLSTAVTLQDVLDAITNADTALSAALDNAGTAIQITDSSSGSSSFAIAALNSSTAVSDLGLDSLTGNSSGVFIGAAIPAGSVRLSGGTEVFLSELNTGNGVSTNDVESLSLTGSTLLSVLNNSDGVSVVSDVDFVIVLTDNSTNVSVDLPSLTSTSTIQTIIDAINSADSGNRLDVAINNSGTGLVLRDTTDDGNNIKVEARNSSPAAADLGILGTGVGPTLNGQAINDVSADIRVTLTNGNQVDIDLSGLETVSEVLDTITEAHARLSAAIDAGTGTKIVLSEFNRRWIWYVGYGSEPVLGGYGSGH